MVYVNTVQVLTESEPRMTGSKLFRFSHRKDGFSYYDINTGDESTNDEMETVEQSLTRQGIPANIYPDRLHDNVIFIRFSKTGELETNRYPYHVLLLFPNEAGNYPVNKFMEDSFKRTWENQVRQGNIYSLSQFMRPDHVEK